MKNIVLLLSAVLFLNCTAKAQHKKVEEKKYKVEKTTAEWKKKLTPMQFHVLREAGTERAGSSDLNYIKDSGTFVCAGCDTALYKSENKFNSGTGWPSFDRAIDKNIELDVDYKIGYKRVELKCNTCGGHLGHRFSDGPSNTTGERHCINGVALKFIADN